MSEWIEEDAREARFLPWLMRLLELRIAFLYAILIHLLLIWALVLIDRYMSAMPGDPLSDSFADQHVTYIDFLPEPVSIAPPTATLVATPPAPSAPLVTTPPVLLAPPVVATATEAPRYTEEQRRNLADSNPLALHSNPSPGASENPANSTPFQPSMRRGNAGSGMQYMGWNCVPPLIPSITINGFPMCMHEATGEFYLLNPRDILIGR